MELYNFCLAEFNIYMEEFINKELPQQHIEKIKYMLEGGKRIRPIIGTAFSVGNQNNWDLLTIVEIIHNTSLILDDTPQMDNDTIRRNNPAFHIKYGVKATYLFSYYLISWVGKYMAKRFSNYGDKYKNCIGSDNVGAELLSLISGQYKDLSWGKSHNSDSQSIPQKYIPPKYIPTLDIVSSIFSKLGDNKQLDSRLQNYFVLILEKTASLFWLPIYLVVWNQQNLSTKYVLDLQKWSYLFGIAFQISDDLLDIQQDTHNAKPNICQILNITETLQFLKLLASELKTILSGISNFQLVDINLLNGIIVMILERCGAV